MRALHLISGLMEGGGQRVALDLAAGLRSRAGIEADIGLLGCSSDRLRAAAAFVVDYDGNYASLRSLAATAHRLRRVLKQGGYGLVHSHGWDADVIARWALGDMAQPQLVHLHVTPAWISSGAFRHRVRRALTRRMLAARQVAIVTVSEAVRQHWGRVFVHAAEKMRVVHNGVDGNRFRPAADGQDRLGGKGAPLVLGTACRLAPQKGLMVLIEAMPRVIAAAGRPLRLDIAGEGAQRPEIEARIGALGLAPHVRLLGPQQDMPGFYRSIDLFVLPSVSDEGLPLAVLEAMASGLAVVATDVGGTAEAVRDRIDGRIVPPRCPEALIATLTELLTQDERRCAMGAEARRRACQFFSLDRQIDDVAAAYRRLLGNAGEGHSLAA